MPPLLETATAGTPGNRPRAVEDLSEACRPIGAEPALFGGKTWVRKSSAAPPIIGRSLVLIEDISPTRQPAPESSSGSGPDPRWPTWVRGTWTLSDGAALAAAEDLLTTVHAGDLPEWRRTWSGLVEWQRAVHRSR
jgi:hypothetical protein